MTAGEIAAVKPGDSILRAFGADDEFRVEQVLRAGLVVLRYSPSARITYRLEPGGAEILAERDGMAERYW